MRTPRAPQNATMQGHLGSRLHVTNLAPDTSEPDLRALFATAGTVSRTQIVRGPDPSDPRVAAYVDMASDRDAAEAIDALHEIFFRGQVLSVTHARPVIGPPRAAERRGGNRRW